MVLETCNTAQHGYSAKESILNGEAKQARMDVIAIENKTML